MGSHYATLGITPGAGAAEIKSAYRRLALQYHPDRNQGPEATSQFQQIQRAYEVLGNAARRKRYDQMLLQHQLHAARRPMSHKGQPARHTGTDDRRYGTRHRFKNPPPVNKPELDPRYKAAMHDFSLFTLSGLRMPRKLWWERLELLHRHIFRKKSIFALYLMGWGMFIFSVVVLVGGSFYSWLLPLGWSLMGVGYVYRAYTMGKREVALHLARGPQ